MKSNKKELAVPYGEIREVSKFTGFEYDILLYKSRQQRLVLGRWLVMEYFIKQKYTFADVAAIFMQDHSTAIHALRELQIDRDGVSLPWRKKMIEQFDSSVYNQSLINNPNDSDYIISEETMLCVASM